jgi:drug/metabolite transporter (DMT)-like permease
VVVVFGLLAAFVYGLGDFVGGFASRSRNAITVLLTAYPVGAVLMLALLPLFPGDPTGRTVLFGVTGGLCGLIGVVLLYSLMAMAPMNVISPVSAVLATIVPVVFGVGMGERPGPLAWTGIALGIAAVTLVSRTGEDHPHGRIAPRLILLACVSGVGFGFYFIFLARAGGDEVGLWPLVISRLASALAIWPLALRMKALGRLPRRVFALALVSGTCDASANLFFLLASREGLLSIASVLTALYPAATVMLAVGVLREHVSRVQLAGLGLAATSIVLVTV